MKVLKFRVKNYKSIIDSGDCYPEPGVTILAGKNEAGKSSILEALEDFNLGTPIREKAVPIGTTLSPEITIDFQLDIRDVGEAMVDLDIAAVKPLPDSPCITVTKRYPQAYELGGELFGKVKYPEYDPIPDLQKAYDALNAPGLNQTLAPHGQQIPPFEEAILVEGIPKLKALRTFITANLASISGATPSTANLFNNLISVIDTSVASIDVPEKAFRERILSLLPTFILFSSFEDIFPNEIALDDLAENKWILDLQKITDIDVDGIKGDNNRRKAAHKDVLNVKLNEDFSRFWTQDVSKLVIDWDGTSLYFWIKENGQYYEPEIRSQGRRWHLAFYVRVTARSRDSASNIILIDEPGLYLHATAQIDILRKLEEAAQGVQVFISTHSPYLIESDRLERLRLVMKDDVLGTQIENKIHRVADVETLTPILTAIGMSLNAGIVAAERMNNVVVEGASDYFYFTAFRRLLGWDLNFISGGSSGNMPRIGTILQGWGCQVIYLYDNDQAFKEAQSNIKSNWLALSKDVLTKLNVDGAVEDLFTREEFVKFVLRDESVEVAGKNSEYMRKKDKVLRARLFLQSVASPTPPTLSDATLAKLAELRTELEAALAKAF